VLQLRPTPRMATDRSGGGFGDGCVAGSGDPRRQGAAGGHPVRMGLGWAVAPDARRRRQRDRPTHPGNRCAGPLDPACLDGGTGPMGPAQPPLCINRCRCCPPGRVSGTHRASFFAPGPGLPCIRGRGPLTTDRLVTPFHASRAKSGPRKVSPMNFTGGSRSIQRLLAARPLLTCWSRGRA
jgi:hypothetical protein